MACRISHRPSMTSPTDASADRCRPSQATWSLRTAQDHAVNLPSGPLWWTASSRPTPRPTSQAMGGGPAFALARRMSGEHGGGAIYIVDLESLTWTKLSD